jgi:hypothetical protein
MGSLHPVILLHPAAILASQPPWMIAQNTQNRITGWKTRARAHAQKTAPHKNNIICVRTYFILSSCFIRNTTISLHKKIRMGLGWSRITGWSKKPLQSDSCMEYGGGVAEISVAGFASPNIVGGRTAAPLWLAVFLRPVHSIAPCLGGDVRGASCPPVPTFRSCNPHIAALFAFASAEGGLSHPNVGVMP